MFSERILVRTLWTGAGVLAFLSCSVKENRDKCPCTLSLEMDRLPALVTILDKDSGEIVQRIVEESPSILKVSHGFLAISLGAMDAEGESPGEVFNSEGALSILGGNDCPKVWLDHCPEVDTEGEYTQISSTLHRSFALLTVKIVKADGQWKPYDIEIEGEVNGYNMDTTPSDGKFKVLLTPDSEYTCRLSLPRQKDNSLLLHIKDEDASLRTFTLGEALHRNGYDWRAPDLSDIEIEINYQFSRINVVTDLWSDSFPLEIVV